MKVFFFLAPIKSTVVNQQLNKSYTINCLICWLLIPLNSWYFRPWIYQNHINEYGVLGSIPSFLFVVVLTLFFWTIIRNKLYHKTILLMSLVVGIVYELLQKDIIPGHTFDPGDLVATGLAGLILLPLIKK